MIDSHAHYDDEQYNDDRDMILSKMKSDGVECIINPASNLESAKKSILLSEKYDFIYAAVGVHPHDAGTCTDDVLNEIYTLSKHPKVVAIGEVGLDYYYDFSPREVQKDCFIKHIRLAKEAKLPLIIHDREAHQDILNIVVQEKAQEVGGVFHCFSGGIQMAEQVINLGFYVSLGGAVTFKNAKKPVAVAGYLPLDKLLVETDCPYMAPVPFRGKRNHSAYVRYVIEKIAEIKKLSFDEIEQKTSKKKKKLFSLGA